MSFFLLKNSLGAKMKRSMRTFCSNDGSTSTLNQQNDNNKVGNTIIGSPYLQNDNPRPSLPTLEEMILQLELEEEMARKAKLNDCNGARRRMSCVNNSDILRSARNALNQYPRFSLDGRDAMYRSSFGKIEGRRSVCFDERRIGREDDFGDGGCFPPTFAGESVVWCKPGVVAKLMGLEAVPVPVRSKRLENKERFVMMRRQNLKRRFERHDLERKLAMEMHGYNGIRRNIKNGSCNGNGYCVMKPVALETPAGGGAGRRRYV
ncbi:hypothetical protein L6164_036703 [Bauhinia variegata]|uniref:Uncharacterized protein n=1 Tax=Bauhinia variegata TaxID=167791 RepID=A0ACB9KHW3_BAUVA|nr:hypothetical protein L6164_036703 [Bauhinia variegata]